MSRPLSPWKISRSSLASLISVVVIAQPSEVGGVYSVKMAFRSDPVVVP